MMLNDKGKLRYPLSTQFLGGSKLKNTKNSEKKRHSISHPKNSATNTINSSKCADFNSLSNGVLIVLICSAVPELFNKYSRRRGILSTTWFYPIHNVLNMS